MQSRILLTRKSAFITFVCLFIPVVYCHERSHCVWNEPFKGQWRVEFFFLHEFLTWKFLSELQAGV